MPEAPELEVVKDFLNERVVGAAVVSASVLRPSVLRPLAGDFVSDIAGRTIEEVERRGKFVLFGLSGDRLLVVNPMLTGAFQYCEPSARKFKRTSVILSLSNGYDLRYVDDRQMGRVYYLTPAQLKQVPQLHDQGPDVLDGISFEDFQQRLARFHGEIKGVLTRGRVISGIGNAYVDENLFAAKVYPFRKRKQLSGDELRRIFEESRNVIRDATETVRERMGDDIHKKQRDCLKVHNKGGEPCPRCGTTITQLTANQRITSYCRKCQPGMLIRGGKG